MRLRRSGRLHRYSLFLGVTVGLAAGLGAMLGFNMVMHETNRSEFCAYCHENNATAEWRQSAHYRNASGAIVGCAECHVPKEFIPKMTVKVQALADVWRYLQGTIDTPEKYESRRLAMAQREWDRLKATGSRECMNCHFPESMANPEQPHVMRMHVSSRKDGEPCMECHKGIAHKPPPESETEASAGQASKLDGEQS